MLLKKAPVLIVLLSIMVMGVGCKKSNGGGFIDSVTGSGKATIGYQVKCDNFLDTTSGEYVGRMTGNVQFNDHAAGVKIHGDIDFVPFYEDDDFTSCEVMAAIIDNETPPEIDISFAAGTYVSHPGGETGEFAILLVEDPSCPTGEGFEIDIAGDINYENGACLRGGNLSVF